MPISNFVEIFFESRTSNSLLTRIDTSDIVRSSEIPSLGLKAILARCRSYRYLKYPIELPPSVAKSFLHESSPFPQLQLISESNSFSDPYLQRSSEVYSTDNRFALAKFKDASKILGFKAVP